MSFVSYIANVAGVDEPAVRLLCTIYSGYVFALIQRLFPFNLNATFKLLYFTVTGGFMIYWNYGVDVYHSALCIIVQYVIFLILGGSLLSVLTSFAFQLGYLLWGYYYYSTTDYDINWCMPQCILTLRLIGLAFDVYDGHKKKEEVTKEQAERAIQDFPGFLEMFGFSYLYCGFLVGPQFPLQLFRDFVGGKLTDNPGHHPNSLLPGFRRCASGTVTLAVQLYLSATFYPMHYVSAEYGNSSFPYKVVYMSSTGFVCFLRYMAIWMINEGVCIVCGLGYKKNETTGEIDWNSVRNVVVHKMLLAESFQEVIDTFNINTNNWVMRYVYKRLRFIGIKEVSQAGVLLFLALWHGIHEGYFTCFFYEFLTMNGEKPMMATLRNWEVTKKMKADPIMKWIPRIIGFLYLHLLFGYCVVDFLLLKWHLFHPAKVAVYYYGHVFFGSLVLFFKIKGLFQKNIDLNTKSS